MSEISGVNSIKTGNNISKPVIQGLYGSRVLVMNNGIKMAEQEWGIEHAPSVDPNAFDHIDVVKGASALKYGGDAIGGVILLESPKYPKKDTLMGKVALSGISNGKGLALNTDITKTWQNGWALRTQGSAKKLGDLETPNYSLQNTGADENAFHFSLQKENTNTESQLNILSSTKILEFIKELISVMQETLPMPSITDNPTLQVILVIK